MKSRSEEAKWCHEYSVETSASPEVIWRIFSDVPGWKTWNAGIEQIEMRGPFAVGTEFLMTPPGQAPLLSRLIDVRENEAFVDETRVDELVVIVAHRIERLGAQRTRVTYAVEATGPGCDEIGPAVSSDFPEVLKSLVSMAESLKTQMKTVLQPYLFFGGRCEEALEFYRTALGAEVDFLMRYKDSPEPMPPGTLAQGFESKVMHTTFRIGGNTLMASDSCEEGQTFEGFSLSLALPSQAEAEKAFSALAVGGHVKMPLTKTFWSPCFGMLTDGFGIGWMISVAG